jgi:hypothetical protein
MACRKSDANPLSSRSPNFNTLRVFAFFAVNKFAFFVANKKALHPLT